MTASRGVIRTTVDERVLLAGTTLRFVLMLVLFVAGSMSMWANVTIDYFGNTRYIDCLLADGYNVDGDNQAQINFDAATGGDKALLRCEGSSTDLLLQYWLPVGITVVLVLLAYGLYRLVPAWKGRARRVTALDQAQVAIGAALTLAELTYTAGLATRPPTFVVRPAVAGDALVYGTRGRTTVCLDAGLLALCASHPSGDEERFRAVVLHELAHIRNRDIPITYATVAMWRVFLAAVLIPQAVLLAYDAISNPWGRAISTINLAQEVFVALLVYLARADILRTRELYADLAAARWGARQEAWLVTDRDHRARAVVGGRRPRTSFRKYWRIHPSWAERNRALDDPAPLFRFGALPMFITGATAGVLSDDLVDFLGNSSIISEIQAYLVGGFLSGIAVVALWRAVIYAQLTGGRIPSGWLAGLSLGLGLSISQLTEVEVSGFQWLPDQPEALLFLLAPCVVLAVWTVQFARLQLSRTRGRTLTVALAASSLPPYLMLATVLVWWYTMGFITTTEWPASAVSQLQTIGLTGEQAAHPNLVLQFFAAVLVSRVGDLSSKFL